MTEQTIAQARVMYHLQNITGVKTCKPIEFYGSLQTAYRDCAKSNATSAFYTWLKDKQYNCKKYRCNLCGGFVQDDDGECWCESCQWMDDSRGCIN